MSPPGDELEETLVSIWSDILNIEPEGIGIDNDFFHLGGNSLRAMRLTSMIHHRLNVKLQLTEMFKSTTIREQAHVIKGAETDSYEGMEAVEAKDYYPLSPSQKRLFILHRLDPDNISYNIPQVFKLKGKIDRHLLENAFQYLIQRHESFRTSFLEIGEELVQIVHSPGSIEFRADFQNMNEEDARGFVNSFPRPFDMGNPPLFRVTFITVREESHIMAVDIHHIISDGVSHGIIAADFMILLGGGRPVPLQLQYKDFAVWKNSAIALRQSEEDKSYWLERLAGEIPVISLPNDFSRPELQCFDGDTVLFELDERETAGLKELAAEKGLSLFMMLLGLYNILLGESEWK